MPSYVSSIVDDTFARLNAVVLLSGPPDTYIAWDSLSVDQVNDVAHLHAFNKQVFPLASASIMDVCKLPCGNSFTQKYAAHLKVRNHRFSQSSSQPSDSAQPILLRDAFGDPIQTTP